ncbi:MAG: glycosyltransferase [Clostridium sp.]
MEGVLFVYLILSIIILLIILIFSSVNLSDYINKSEFERCGIEFCNKGLIGVSILVPAYNEEVTICDTIESLINLDYENYEIVVISDGSMDKTVSKVIEKYNLNIIFKPMKGRLITNEVISVYKGESDGVCIILIDKLNGGKADALNVGINYATKELIVAVDADSMLSRDSIKNIVKPFLLDRRVIAVGGNIKIANFISLKNGIIVNEGKYTLSIATLQVVEYLRAFFLSRVAFDYFNMNLIISGAFGAFKKNVVLDVGGYRSDTVGEDMELVMRLHKHYLNRKEKYKVTYVADAICYTQAPNNMKGLKSQRERWQSGLIHCFQIHREMLISTRWLIGKTYFILFELVTPLIEIIGGIFMICSFILGFGSIKYFIMYSLIIGVNSFFTSIIAIILDIYLEGRGRGLKNKIRLIFISLFEGLGYRQMISIFRLMALIKFKKGSKTWGEIKRETQN